MADEIWRLAGEALSDGTFWNVPCMLSGMCSKTVLDGNMTNYLKWYTKKLNVTNKKGRPRSTFFMRGITFHSTIQAKCQSTAEGTWRIQGQISKQKIFLNNFLFSESNSSNFVQINVFIVFISSLSLCKGDSNHLPPKID